MTTLIKKVERENIVLVDCEVGQFSWKIFWINLAGIVISGAYLFSIQLLTIPIRSVLIGVSIVLAVTVMVFCFGMIVLGYCQTGVPGYSIQISGDRDSERCVRKTTPEQDQKAICRITNELESRAREKSKKERELEQIAQRCK